MKFIRASEVVKHIVVDNFVSEIIEINRTSEELFSIRGLSILGLTRMIQSDSFEWVSGYVLSLGDLIVPDGSPCLWSNLSPKAFTSSGPKVYFIIVKYNDQNQKPNLIINGISILEIDSLSSLRMTCNDDGSRQYLAPAPGSWE